MCTLAICDLRLYTSEKHNHKTDLSSGWGRKVEKDLQGTKIKQINILNREFVEEESRRVGFQEDKSKNKHRKLNSGN